LYQVKNKEAIKASSLKRQLMNNNVGRTQVIGNSNAAKLETLGS